MSSSTSEPEHDNNKGYSAIALRHFAAYGTPLRAEPAQSALKDHKRVIDMSDSKIYYDCSDERKRAIHNLLDCSGRSTSKRVETVRKQMLRRWTECRGNEVHVSFRDALIMAREFSSIKIAVWGVLKEVVRNPWPQWYSEAPKQATIVQNVLEGWGYDEGFFEKIREWCTEYRTQKGDRREVACRKLVHLLSVHGDEESDEGHDDQSKDGSSEESDEHDDDQNDDGASEDSDEDNDDQSEEGASEENSSEGNDRSAGDKNELIENLQEVLKSKDKLLEDKDKTIDQKNELLDYKDKQLEKIGEILKQKDGLLAAKDALLGDNDELLRTTILGIEMGKVKPKDTEPLDDRSKECQPGHDESRIDQSDVDERQSKEKKKFVQYFAKLLSNASTPKGTTSEDAKSVVDDGDRQTAGSEWVYLDSDGDGGSSVQ